MGVEDRKGQVLVMALSKKGQNQRRRRRASSPPKKEGEESGHGFQHAAWTVEG